MTLSEILPAFLEGKPIQRQGMWADSVYIETDKKKIRLMRDKKVGRECLRTYSGFDRYFSLDDITANDWKIKDRT